MKTILITTEFKRIEKIRWPQYVKDFIDNPDVNAVHPEAGSKIAYHRFNTEKFPRLAFFEEKDSEGNIVYVIRKYFEKHESYDEFRLQSEDEKRSECKYSSSDENDLKNEFAKFIADKPKPPLPVEMRDFENTRDFSNTATTYVFEMEEWCKHIGNKELEDDKKEIFMAIQQIVIDKENITIDTSGWYKKNYTEGKTIVYRFHKKDNHAYYYFFDIGANVNLSVLSNKYIDLSDDRLLKQARKGYPDWILYGDFEDWKKLENDDEANLALSDEEIEVLNKAPYPYFVNGLAGSGKSTILYYLFAHAYSYKKVKPLDLLFLSYSPGLITKAKSVIKALLRTNPSYHGFELNAEEEVLVDKCFWPFQYFLINTFITTDEEICCFSNSNHLSYEQFQKEYKLTCKLNEANNYSAAIVWSVIRSFIKGRNCNNTFTIESYKGLHKNDRTVDVSDFENIYKIWKNWYKPTFDGKRWDDLDLIIYVLKKIGSGVYFKKYDIVYCDEAQDFTPIENELILKLSKYTDYDLKDFRKIPIAYAGDPNQTVSPTGFNWKRLKEIVDNTFCTLAGEHIKLKEKTLNNNYRSKRTIVEFANSIQYIRKYFLTDESLTPQEQWNPQANPLPGFFFLTTDGTRDDDMHTIQEGFAKTECIITGAEGEYERQLDNKEELTADSMSIDDSLLASIDNKTKLYTAISSKGLEFKAVLLYRFADQLPNCFSRILNKENDFNESDKYELAHFFTKLYIAISRAKEVLYIADTQENYDRFWKYFIDNTFVNELLKDRQDYNAWYDKIGGIVIGEREEYLKRMADNFSPLETARKIYEDAKFSKHAKDMNRAVGYFEEAGDITMAEMSKAYVLLYEKEYLESGKKFLKLGETEEATKAFWCGCCWDELSQNGSGVYKLTAEFMKGELSFIDYIKTENIEERFDNLDEIWRQVTIYLSKEAQKIPSENIFASCKFMENLVSRGFVNLNPTLAVLYFKGKKYTKAIEKWDDLANSTHDNKYREHKDYYYAQEATCQSTSDRIFWMSKGGKHDDILRNYSTPKDAEIYAFDDRARKIVFSLLNKPSTFDQALNYPYNSDEKLYLLYKVDRIKFIEQYVLSDFNEDKFVTWIDRPIKENGSDLFDNEIPTSLFYKVFAMPLMKDWSLFMKLVDNGGYHVMKNGVNINRIADAISDVLSTKYYISLASCFLDVVFNNPNYNFANANKHIDTIVKIFSESDFTTRDFIVASGKNTYFKEIGLDGVDVDRIKDRLRSFVKTKLGTYKKIKQSDYHTVKTLCKIYEKVAPQKQNEQGKYVIYDCDDVLSFYKDIQKKNTISDELKTYFEIRKAVVEAHYKGNQAISDFDNTMPKYVSIENILLTCDKEDAIWLVGFIFGRKTIGSSSMDKWGMALTKIIYKLGIFLSDYDRSIKDNLKENFINFANNTIETILSAEKINEYNLKLCAYLYEVFMDKDADRAGKYDNLSKLPRLSKLYKLVSYLQHRALHFYSYGNENKYKMISIDYDTSLPIDLARKEEKPVIEEVNNDKSVDNNKLNTSIKSKDKKTSDDISQRAKTKVLKDESLSPDNPLFAAKMAQLEMARNLKQMGVPIETIHQAAPQLTIDEIAGL